MKYYGKINISYCCFIWEAKYSINIHLLQHKALNKKWTFRVFHIVLLGILFMHASGSKAWFTYNTVMPATCLRDSRRCFPAYVNICRRRNADTSPTLKHCRRQIVEVELDSTLPIGRRHHLHEMHVYVSSVTYIFMWTAVGEMARTK